MKLILIGLALLVSSGAFCQSEKEESNRIDSLQVYPFEPKGVTTNSPCMLATDISGYEFGTNRTRLNPVHVNDKEVKQNAVIHYKLTIDSFGNVVAFTHISNSTTTTDLTLINAIGVAIKEQVKYNKVEESPLVYQYYTVAVKANKQ